MVLLREWIEVMCAGAKLKTHIMFEDQSAVLQRVYDSTTDNPSEKPFQRVAYEIFVAMTPMTCYELSTKLYYLLYWY